jgi:hypothetical protein
VLEEGIGAFPGKFIAPGGGAETKSAEYDQCSCHSFCYLVNELGSTRAEASQQKPNDRGQNQHDRPKVPVPGPKMRPGKPLAPILGCGLAARRFRSNGLMQMMPHLVKQNLCNPHVTKVLKTHQTGWWATGNDIIRDELYPCRFTLPFVMVEATDCLASVFPAGNSLGFPATNTR